MQGLHTGAQKPARGVSLLDDARVPLPGLPPSKGVWFSGAEIYGASSSLYSGPEGRRGVSPGW